jgi:hypothetical protein
MQIYSSLDQNAIWATRRRDVALGVPDLPGLMQEAEMDERQPVDGPVMKDGHRAVPVSHGHEHPSFPWRSDVEHGAGEGGRAIQKSDPKTRLSDLLTPTAGGPASGSRNPADMACVDPGMSV